MENTLIYDHYKVDDIKNISNIGKDNLNEIQFLIQFRQNKRASRFNWWNLFYELFIF